MGTSFSYYDILGITETASADAVKTAYRAAMLKYHPDVNTAPNAQRLTEIINDAYAVLSDAARRKEYDRSLAAGAPMPEPGEKPDEVWEFFACDECHKVDVHLRYAMFFRVFSIIIYSHMSGAGGILCPDCRSKLAISTALFSAFLGPWGFPWGIFYALRSLFASLRGGELPRQQNAQLLRHQGIAFLQRGFVNEARSALASSLRFEKSATVTNLLNEPVFKVSTILPQPGWSRGQTISALLFLVPPAIIMILLMWFGSSSGPSTSTGPGSSTPGSRAAENIQLKTLITTCNTAGDSKLNQLAAYDACTSILKWLDGDFKSNPVRSKAYQQYSLIADKVRIYKADAAFRLGWSDVAMRSYDQSQADLKNLKTYGVTAVIRSDAKRDYDCFVNNVCKK